MRPGSVLVTGRLGDEAAEVARRVAAEHQVPLVRLGVEVQLRDHGDALTVGRREGASTTSGWRRWAPSSARTSRSPWPPPSLCSPAWGVDRWTPKGSRNAAARPGPARPDGGDLPRAAGDARRRAQPERRAGPRRLASGCNRRRRPVAVVSIMDDKDAAGILAALVPVTSGAIFTRASRQGALPPATLASLWSQLEGGPAQIVPEPAEALAQSNPPGRPGRRRAGHRLAVPAVAADP